MNKSPSASPDFAVREFSSASLRKMPALKHIMQVRFGGTRFDCPKCGTVESTFHKLQQHRKLAA